MKSIFMGLINITLFVVLILVLTLGVGKATISFHKMLHNQNIVQVK